MERASSSTGSARVGDGPGAAASSAVVEFEERRELAVAVKLFLAVLDEEGPGPWRAQAACRGVGPAEFFAPAAAVEGTGEAGRWCGGCEVREECLAWALELGPAQSGVAGGFTEAQRARVAVSSSVSTGSGSRAWKHCEACERLVEGVGADRLRSGYCTKCYVAWRRGGRPERAEFELRRRERSSAA